MTVKAGPLRELDRSTEFVRRHIGPGDEEIAAMLNTLGIESLDALIDRAVPPSIRSKRPLGLAEARSETATLTYLRRLAGRNRILKSFIGLGYYGCITPPVILRNVLENPGWYTAYTPYQPEISQGRLEALLNFQTMVADLTGMALANASLLDEATAAAEAMNMALHLAKSESRRFVVEADCHPQTIAVVETRARPLGIEVAVVPGDKLAAESDYFGLLLQYPGSGGALGDPKALIERAHDKGALAVVASDLLALTLLTPPGELGADIVVGSAQRFGVPLCYGGPHAGFMATKDEYKRSVPGRLVGVSIDSHGRSALRLALQTREQHIRREKATSNICTAQVLLAVMSAFYAVYHGPEGLTRIARRVHRLTAVLAAGLKRLGFAIENPSFFDTITIAVPGKAREIVERAEAAGYNLRVAGRDRFAISLDETATAEDLAALWQAFAGKPAGFTVAALDVETADAIPATQRRASRFLEHPVFQEHRSETEMLRYLRRLMDKDIALDRAMIPLGSCTMKLNATTEMIPITWPELSDIHPFVPKAQAEGYRALFAELEGMLADLTGFAAVSLQPNAGSQGEYAGLLAIRKHHQERGEGARNLCLIPSSAHGTNPASAALAGLKVVVVDCDEAGNIDLADLKAKAEANKTKLAALMVTYPSTHGVFEEAIVEICRIVHDNGGQVYMDGANLNALLGIARPATIGADVMHMNLHKTFCIPHGGGGPGVGPIGVAAHLAPYLPNHPLISEAGPATGVGAVAAAPWGSAGILPISWSYIAMMGGAGLRKATEVAILNANYIARRLEEHYPVLYRGRGGLVAHECIVDLRPLKQTSGITVDDVAKRLIDYGFHAPTMSFPVAGTLMIEPTESESKRELDRFCDAMIAIRAEIRRVEEGVWDRDDNPLRRAPHTVEELTADDWPHSYSRAEAGYPVAALKAGKYWPPVGRVDNVYGDRNLVCACPPLESYRDAAE
ncbi:MAG: aminomethyl-transferring glycine dehydrogenase [Kiloniellales bacterium]